MQYPTAGFHMPIQALELLYRQGACFRVIAEICDQWSNIGFVVWGPTAFVWWLYVFARWDVCPDVCLGISPRPLGNTDLGATLNEANTEHNSAGLRVTDIILGRWGHKKGLWGIYSFATAQTFIQSKEVSGVQQEVGVQIVAQNKQIQGYMVPKQHKNSHVCVCGFSLMWNSETFYWLDLHRTACVACTILLTEAVKKGEGRGEEIGGRGRKWGRNREKLNFLRSDVGAICERRCELVH